MDILEATTAFAALSQETRVRAFRLLIAAGDEGMAAGDIADHLNAKQNTSSANLSVLLQSGLIRREREGRSIRYFMNKDGLCGLLAYLLQDCCGGRSDICQPFINEITATCCSDGGAHHV